MNLQENIQRIRTLLETEDKKKIKHFEYPEYTLIISNNPCDVFLFFEVDEMHGLNLKDCRSYGNSDDDAYIAGLSNISPIDGKPFVFFNTSRMGDGMKKMGLIMHEMMHLSFRVHNYDIEKEEEIITWAEEQSYKLYQKLN